MANPELVTGMLEAARAVVPGDRDHALAVELLEVVFLSAVRALLGGSHG